MAEEEFEIYDTVSIDGEQGAWTVVGTRSEGLYEVQLGNDAASKKFVGGAKIKLIAKAKKPDSGPGFFPGRSIME